MKSRSYLYNALATTLNIILNALSLGDFLWLEGRVKRGKFRNWARQFSYKPKTFAQPKTEQDLIALMKNSNKIRLFGSAHSFNPGVITDGTLVSLDKYSGVIGKDLNNKQMTFKGGTRVRDVIDELLKHKLAFEALPSHDAQSIGGILSTDVHGTGNKEWGFVSQSVTALKIIDGNGEIHKCTPSDDLFKAAIGGIGAVGIISEVTVQAVPKFNVQQKFEVSSWKYVKSNLDMLLDKHEHLSLYLFPFTDKCQISTWDETEEKQTLFGSIWEFVSISKDALLSSWFGNLMTYTGLLPRFSDAAHGFKKGTDIVMESNEAFNRTIYHLHQELEFAIPFEETATICDRFLKLYEDIYTKELPYTLLEVRFTPNNQNRTLIGAGRERRSTWIDLICNDSHGFEKYYSDAEDLIKELDARPHLGKFCQKIDKNDLQRLHGENFEKFLELRDKYDPKRKFVNKFTQRLFGD